MRPSKHHRPSGSIPVGGAMESILSYPVLSPHFIRQGIYKRILRQCLVESGIKYHYHWGSGIIWRQASIPVIFSGLCKGARSMHSRIASLPFSSIIAESWNFSCTTMSDRGYFRHVILHLSFHRYLLTSLMASLWFSFQHRKLRSFPVLYVMNEFPTLHGRKAFPRTVIFMSIS